ncbi:MAG: FRG domain-containing protein [Arenicellales bacterium WSBS_2016_MAG_OTU3]
MAKQQNQSIVAHYMQQIKESAQSKDCVYRGQADAEWPLQSGVERRMRKALEDADDEIPSDSIKSYHDNLLDKARERGFGRVDGRDLDDLELLAALQHFGAATCLLDFTKQALVALYFACQPENKKDGKIFIVPYRTIPSASGKEIIKDLLTNDKPSLWRPMLHGAAERRIMTQAGLFLINITDEHEDMQHVIISKKDKNKILEELDSTYQISAETLFMDLSGFAQNQTADKAFSDHLTYLYNGITKHKREF